MHNVAFAPSHRILPGGFGTASSMAHADCLLYPHEQHRSVRPRSDAGIPGAPLGDECRCALSGDCVPCSMPTTKAARHSTSSKAARYPWNEVSMDAGGYERMQIVCAP